MMKTVRVLDNIVSEIIPEDALPVADWYGEEFAKNCMSAPDNVEQNWVYAPESGSWMPPNPPESVPTPPTQLDQIQAQVTYTALKTGTLIPGGEAR